MEKVGKTTRVNFDWGNSELKNLKRVFGVCDVFCLDRQRRLWIVPRVKETLSGYSVLKTAYIGDPSPREIGFVPTKEDAMDYLFHHKGIPPTAWKKCPVFSMMNPTREIN